MSQARKYKVRRVGIESTTEGDLNRPITWAMHKEKKMAERWEKELYGAIKVVTGKQIGGQAPGSGPDVLKYIKQHDPDNSAGSIKKGLDIMLKLQDATFNSSLMSSIQPLQSILGGSLYGAMQSAGSAGKAQGKAKKKKKQKDEQGEEVIVEEDLGIIAELINAAMAILSPEDAVLAADLLDDNEISKIESAYYSGGVYTSTVMPVAFVNAINLLMPTFRSTVGIV